MVPPIPVFNTPSITRNATHGVAVARRPATAFTTDARPRSTTRGPKAGAITKKHAYYEQNRQDPPAFGCSTQSTPKPANGHHLDEHGDH
jgi:hypothetical protein